MKDLTHFEYAHIIWIGLIFLLPLIGGCQKKDASNGILQCPVDAVAGSETDIGGKWKLVKGEHYSSNSRQRQTKDYSCNNIVYQFHSDGRLIISSDIEDNIGFAAGEYMYEATLHGGGQNDLLKIGNNLYAVAMFSDKMTVEINPIDPLAIYESKLTAYFIRIQSNDSLN
ncbi:hypothetical protein FW774_01140 (plasmid) [Pedobacter sp. BS3]|uniref:hypothetical protein n=1 Tax=Pedobacter sp. BS3 TaxID=2567937 RepID=UPI0011EC3628|nr:hypothetical protein [Pedobacter sp. BS3]TZF85711.1 hypothetical protein FW774_01140 [Pedobacter sp. BS3]